MWAGRQDGMVGFVSQRFHLNRVEPLWHLLLHLIDGSQMLRNSLQICYILVHYRTSP